MKKSYSIGRVTGRSLNGGLVGHGHYSAIDDSFWEIDSSGQSTSTYGGSGKTEAQMKSGSTFTDALWDFSGTRAINASANNGKP